MRRERSREQRNVNRWILWISYFHDDLYRANFLRPTPRAIHRAVEGSNWDWPKARRIRALPDTNPRVRLPKADIKGAKEIIGLFK